MMLSDKRRTSILFGSFKFLSTRSPAMILFHQRPFEMNVDRNQYSNTRRRIGNNDEMLGLGPRCLRLGSDRRCKGIVCSGHVVRFYPVLEQTCTALV